MPSGGGGAGVDHAAQLGVLQAQGLRGGFVARDGLQGIGIGEELLALPEQNGLGLEMSRSRLGACRGEACIMP